MQSSTLELLKRPIAYQPILGKAFGSVKLAILWGQLYFWRDKGNDPDGWIYKTRENIFDETALQRREQETARRIGKELGIMEEKLIGYPPKMHFKVNEERAAELVEKYLAKNPRETKKFGVKMVSNLFGGEEVAEGVGKEVMRKKPSHSISYLKQIPKEDILELVQKYGVDEKYVLARAEDVVDYCESKGKQYKDYKATLRNFIKTHMSKHMDEVREIRKKIKEKKQADIDYLESRREQNPPEKQAEIDAKIKEIKESLVVKFKI